MDKKNLQVITLSEEDLNLLLDKINDLYVMTRTKYLTMYTDKYGQSRWNTVQQALTDRLFLQHLKHESTIGVFSGQALTKFICFDIDSESLSYSKHICQYLQYVLIEEFSVPKQNIIISFSGMKGYHVEIFFIEALSLEVVKSFYNAVLSLISNQMELFCEIEFRPSYKQGVKVPLSINRNANTVCWFVDSDTFELIEDPTYLLSVQPLDIEYFQSKVMDNIDFDILEKNFSISKPKALDTEGLLQETNPMFKSDDGFLQDCMEILSENRLLHTGTRNNVTFQLAILLYEQGLDKENTKQIIAEVLENTWKNHRTLISKETTYAYMMEEVTRISDYVYKKGLFSAKTDYRIYKSDLLAILSIKKKHLRKLLFSLYIHSKKYARKNGNFYMAYSVMTAMGNTTERGRLLKFLKELELLGYISIIQRGKLNEGMIKELSKQSTGLIPFYEANIYRVNLKPINTDTFFTVQFSETVELVEAIVQLVPENEVKNKLSKTQFYTEYKSSYQKATEGR